MTPDPVAPASLPSSKMSGYAFSTSPTSLPGASLPGIACVVSDQDTPFHQRSPGGPDGSGYHPGSGELSWVTGGR